MDAGPPIDEDLRCVGCGGSLRGGRLGGKCAGCGREVMATFVAAARGVMGEQSEVVEKLRRGWISRGAVVTGYPYEAVRFVAAVMPYVFEKSGAEEGFDPDAKALCRGFGEQLVEVYGSMEAARRQMVEWRVTTSEDLGRIVFGLVKIGLVVPGEGEHVLDFSGVFTLYTLFDAGGLA